SPPRRPFHHSRPRLPPGPPPLPYTPLFRSPGLRHARELGRARQHAAHPAHPASAPRGGGAARLQELRGAQPREQDGAERPSGRRSEEHTSELQSRENLVCRLLLEKKKTSHS